MERHHKVFWTIVSAIIFIALVLFSSYLSEQYSDEIGNLIGDGFLGMIIYVTIVVLAAVLAPISTVPLIPLVSSLWGWPVVAGLTLFGEVLGGTIAFLIARHYGYGLVKKIVSLEKIHKYERMVPERNIFWGIVVVRIAIPTDFMSYLIGIFSKVSLTKYIWATALGFLPYALFVSYLGVLEFIHLVVLISVGTLLFVLIILSGLYSKKKFRKRVERWWDKRFK